MTPRRPRTPEKVTPEEVAIGHNYLYYALPSIAETICKALEREHGADIGYDPVQPPVSQPTEVKPAVANQIGYTTFDHLNDDQHRQEEFLRQARVEAERSHDFELPA